MTDPKTPPNKNRRLRGNRDVAGNLPTPESNPKPKRSSDLATMTDPPSPTNRNREPLERRLAVGQLQNLPPTSESLPRPHMGSNPATTTRGTERTAPRDLVIETTGQDTVPPGHATAVSQTSTLPDTPARPSDRPQNPATENPAPSQPSVPNPAATLRPTQWTSQTPTQGDKRPTTTHPTDTTGSPKRARLHSRHNNGSTRVPVNPPRPFMLGEPDPEIPPTSFAPAYDSVFLRQNPNLKKLLAHVNCSYLTTHNGIDPHDRAGRANTAPSLVELKQHARSLIVLIREMSVGARGGLINYAALGKDVPEGQDPAPLEIGFFDGLDAFDFLNDLGTPYVNREPAENVPLTSLLNQLRTVIDPDDGEVRTIDICPLTKVKPIRERPDMPLEFRPGVNPLPHSQINRLMKHADELLLHIDNALSASGGFLAALPLDLPDSDPRRKTFIGQMIHFMRVLVGRVHVLDRDYGQALGLLAGEATVPAEMKLKLTRPEQLQTAYVAAQHQYILNTSPETYEKIWQRLRAVACDTARRECNGMGLLDITISTRYRALLGGKTIFITPMVDDIISSQVVGRPTVVACPQPGFGTRTSEWERKNGAALVEAKSWQKRAMAAEADNKRLHADIEALEPEDVWHDGEKIKVLDMWRKLSEREDMFAEEKRQAKLFAQRNNKMDSQIRDLENELAAAKRGAEARAQRIAEKGMEGLRSQIKDLIAQLGKSTEKLQALPGSAEEMERIVREHAVQRKQVVDLQGELARARREGGGRELERLRGEVAALKARGTDGEGEGDRAEVERLTEQVADLMAELVSVRALPGKASAAEVEKLRREAETAKMYKERTKGWHQDVVRLEMEVAGLKAQIRMQEVEE